MDLKIYGTSTAYFYSLWFPSQEARPYKAVGSLYQVHKKLYNLGSVCMHCKQFRFIYSQKY